MSIFVALRRSIVLEPESWVYDGFSMVHERSRTTIWVANGMWFFGPKRACYPGTTEYQLSVVEKFRLRRHVKLWMATRAVVALAPTPPAPVVPIKLVDSPKETA